MVKKVPAPKVPPQSGPNPTGRPPGKGKAK
jgi:hypothetical protein